MNIEKYIPYYPEVQDDAFYRQIVSKFEFQEEAGASFSDDNSFFTYQRSIARFLSAKTLYDSLLLVHEMGTGKTSSAIATALLVKQQDPSFRRIIVLANGKTQLNNFRNEIFERVSSIRSMIPKQPGSIDPETIRKGILRKNGFYFDTYRLFAKSIEKKSNEELRRTFDYSIVIFDEVHNLSALGGGPVIQPSKPKKISSTGNITNARAYEVLYRFVHTVGHIKLLCLTGTPIRDKPQEIAPLLNLVIPQNDRFPVGEEFRQRYLDVVEHVDVLGDVVLDRIRLRPSAVSDFRSRIRGRVSYLKQSFPDNIRVVYERNDTDPEIVNMKLPMSFPVFAVPMSPLQTQIYLEDFIYDLQSSTGKPVGEEIGEGSDSGSDSEEEEEVGTGTKASSSSKHKEGSLAYANSKQSSLMVFPTKDPVSSYIRIVYDKSKTDPTKHTRFIKTILWTKQMRQLFPKNIAFDQKIHMIRQYSTIYAYIVNEIIQNPSKLVYIYSFLKAGSGIYVLVSFLVEYFDFKIVRNVSEATETTSRRKLLILNRDFINDQDLRDLINFFNRDDNCRGQHIQVVIGTKQTKEGITLKNIQQVHVVQPDWNYADISQAIARGIRVKSHDALVREIGDVLVQVFQYAAIPIVEDKPDPEYSIDVEQYRRSEIKDRNMKVIERELIINSWDCQLNKERNTGVQDLSRRCEYQECSYSCEGIPKGYDDRSQRDFSTYNLYYSATRRDMIADKIRDVFHTSNVFTRKSLFDHIKDTSVQNDTGLTYDAIDRLRIGSLKNNRGDDVYLRSSDDGKTYFTVIDPLLFALQEVTYNTDPIVPLVREHDFPVLASNFYVSSFKDILRKSMDLFFAGHQENARQIVLQAPVTSQEIAVECMVVSKYSSSFAGTTLSSLPYIDFMIRHYKDQQRISINKESVVSTLLPDKRRVLYLDSDPLVWSDAVLEKKSDVEYEKTQEFIHRFIINNPYKIYGIIEIGPTKTSFKIRDVSDQQAVFGSNKAKVPKGEMCANSFSKKKEGLIQYLWRLNWIQEPQQEVDAGLSVQGTDLKTIRDALKKTQVPSMLGINVDNTDADVMRRIFFLWKQKIPDLCAIVRSRLTALDLIHEKTV